MSHEAMAMWGCGQCERVLERRVTKIDGVTWTTLYCPEHGDVFTSADAGELDLGIVRESKLERNDFQFFAEEFIDHVDSRPPRPTITVTEERRDWSIAIIIATLIAAVIIAVSLLTARDSRDDSGSRILTSESVATTPPTVWQTTNPPTALTEPAEVTTAATATRAAVQIQVTEPPPPPVPVRPEAIPGDCGSWERIFRWYGATDEEIYFFFVTTPWGRTNVISRESMCGLRFRNPDTSDTGICQLNGVHRDWVWAEFGLRLGSGVGEAEASNPEYARACLRLLRGESNEPNAMKYACAWRPGRFCS